MSGFRFADGFFYVGDHKYPVAHHWHSDEDTIGMKLRGVHLSFENRWKLSIIWGSCTYSSNHGHPFDGEEFIEEPAVVEIGLLKPDGALFNSDVVGYCTPEDVLEAMRWARKYPSHDPVIDTDSTEIAGELG